MNKFDNDEATSRRKALAQHFLSTMDRIFDSAGLTIEKMAEERYAELHAVTVKTIRMRGVLVNPNLPEGYRVIAVCQAGKNEFETLLEMTVPDFSTRVKAATEIEKMRGWRDKDEDSEEKTTIIEIVSNVPEPLPMPQHFIELKKRAQTSTE